MLNNSKIAVITGAASGIGRTVAERLAIERGVTVCVVDRNAHGAEEVADSVKEAGGKAFSFVADLSDPDVVVRALHAIDETVGTPDIVVNNAGIAHTAPALEYPLANWRTTMAINLTAPFLIMQHTLPAMKSKGWGRIVNVASISGVRAGTGRVGYGTSKAGLIALTRQFAIEAAEWGVTVNAVAPGPVETPLVKQLHGGSTTDTYARLVPMARYGTTDEIAAAVLFLTSEDASYITGDTLAVDGGFLAGGLLVRDMFESAKTV